MQSQITLAEINRQLTEMSKALSNMPAYAATASDAVSPEQATLVALQIQELEQQMDRVRRVVYGARRA